MYHSILDTDLYKFTVSYAYMKMFPDAECTFVFKDRNKVRRSKKFLIAFKKKMQELSMIHLTDTEFYWVVKNIPFIPEYYWEWLRSFRFEYNKMKIYLDEDGILTIEVTDKCHKASLYEIPHLFTVPEVNNVVLPIIETGSAKPIDWDITLAKLKEKVDLSNNEGFTFSEFGTRRRFSYEVQDKIVAYLKEHAKNCVGTSNVHFAMKYNMRPCGTHPHEWFMFHAAQFGYKNANYMALENWVNVYDGDLGTALTDTYTSDVFFRNFSLKQAKLFDGIRQDSGDEFEFIEKAINFYKLRGIDPRSKTIIFSNALDFEKASIIAKVCSGRIKCRISVNSADSEKLHNFINGDGKKLIGCSFGIGTNLTCDVYAPDGTKYSAENIVEKMGRCRMNEKQPWYNCIKISDDLGKHMGDHKDFENACYELGIKI